ncbi:MAG: YbhB/YbcL family Raf kinase inhibitor-like protein [Elusimicrobia bacterium]|nr:YbhB/YbcL family Raf kinase inhibitor-like protein [Elusimicrobiota bacterium]
MDQNVEKGPYGFTLTSPAFKNGEKIPKVHTGDGKDLSPGLHWTGWPKETKSFALIMDDPDAPPGTWVHWVLYDIPAGLKDLPEGVAKKEIVQGVGKHGLCWGVSSFDRVGYYGPLPPPGTPHRYFFKRYALDKELGLKPRATKEQLVKAMEGHILASAELIGLYQR